MGNVVAEKGIALDFKVAAEVARADSVVGNPCAREAAKIAIGVLEVVSTDGANNIHETELLKRREGIELGHALIAEGDLQQTARGEGGRGGIVFRGRLWVFAHKN